MNMFESLLKAGHYKIISGSEYLWQSFGENARYLDLENKLPNTEFENYLTIVYDIKTQEVYESYIYSEILKKVYRWINPKYIKDYYDEALERDIDIRLYSDELHYNDCDLFEDYLNKVTDIFNTGVCNQKISIEIDIDDGIEITNEIVEKVLKDSIEKSKHKFQQLWQHVHQKLNEKNIKLVIQNKINNLICIEEEDVIDIINWIESLDQKDVVLEYRNKLKYKELINELKAENGELFIY